MSPARFLRPMSPDLLALGDQIEAAAARAVRRRRARRTAFLNGFATLAVALPLALAAATADVSTTRPALGKSAAGPAIKWAPGSLVPVAHIRDEYLPAHVETVSCLDGKECRIRIPFTLEEPLGKV